MAEASAGSKREISESNQRRKARHRPAPHLHSRTAWQANKQHAKPITNQRYQSDQSHKFSPIPLLCCLSLHSYHTMNPYDAQTGTERDIERLHTEQVMIIELKIDQIQPKTDKLNPLIRDIEMAVLTRVHPAIVTAIAEDKNKYEVFSVLPAANAFILHVAKPIAESTLAGGKMRVETDNGTTIFLTPVAIEESARGKKETYLKAILTIGLKTLFPGFDVLKAAVNAAATKVDMPKVDTVRAMTTQSAGGGTGKFMVVFHEPDNFKPNPTRFAMMTDIVLPGDDHADLNFSKEVKAKFNLCPNKCNRSLDYDMCTCTQKSGYGKAAKEKNKANFYARLDKKRARTLQGPPPQQEGSPGAGSSNGH